MWIKDYHDLLFPVDVNQIGLRGYYMRKITETDIPIPDNQMIKQADDIKLANLPHYLYKYRQFDVAGYSIHNLINDSLWFSKPEDFNDPFDSRSHSYTLDFIETQLDLVQRFEQYITTEKVTFKNDDLHAPSSLNSLIKITQNNDIVKKAAYGIQTLRDSGESDLTLDKAYKATFEYILTNFTVEEWTSHKTIINMMRERADIYNMLHYDAPQILTKVCSLCEVNDSILMWSHYADRHSGFCIEYDLWKLPRNSDLLKNLHPVFYHDVSDSEPEDNLNGIKFRHLYAVLRKSSEWKYEHEWRFVYYYDDLEGNILRLPVISAIYLGCRINKMDKEKVLTIAKQKKIKVFVSQKKGRTLSFEPVLLE